MLIKADFKEFDGIRLLQDDEEYSRSEHYRTFRPVHRSVNDDMGTMKGPHL